MTYIRNNKPVGENFIEHIVEDQLFLIIDSERKNKIELIGKNVDKVTSLVNEYTLIDSTELDTDDEIINWTFPDVNADLISATWNLYSGLYKTSASCLRNSFEMSFLALYFQMRQNLDLLNGISGYNKYFSEWDNGKRPTPNWGEMKSIVKQNQNIINYNLSRNCDLIEEVYTWFSYLCNFTHGKPFDNSIELSSSKPTNHMNIGVGFEIKNFERFSDYLLDTMSWISVFWCISYPEILNNSSLKESYKPLFKDDRAKDVFNYIINLKQ